MRRRDYALGALAGVVAMTIAGLGHAEDALPKTPNRTYATVPGKTGKERLGDKASDEQRVDNCKVPLERRGATIRPDTCPPEK